ncbi:MULTISPECIES: SDR family NAD(P)-dependent oxidoreductase [Psychrilyobacter]|uniref:SDR family NAD(P)-dependent oxidoreductase n=1 Tax=Psychrilyobacter piezotolerans TaxID=2293438 RepID=A0ABX9KHE0_9FUSO|nr:MULTISPECIES: SDR family NAD(P)-dependent oxidoreductase [Psychrilyobacter]MCS5421445.1 SDR family NAD(P)-dependent oxidoreductase [Psychrilyobacter sp. S5]NDI77803.1 SDR family NAD(P)-dependent oxidoreductase [Psychrilyobacter piezotolerans]RDE62344.1 SDR family NAD(P)-dependent oxidoreductase [Psychrilyobacter sp. S5]REI41442.1 SDR family NAD(P)-dependent oxidoreductase [Psychrilyobacter piezotolerans]
MKKIVLITGASSGIGRATALRYAEKSYDLILVARRMDKLEELKNEILGFKNIEIKLLQMDISDSEEVKNKINSLEDRWKQIDILVNSAGLALGMDKIHESEYSSFDNVIDVNIKGLLYVSKTVIPLMLEAKLDGHVVNLGSTAGRVAYSGGGVYCASKAAVKTLSDAMRIDLIDTPIRVTNIEPGMVETPFSNVRFRGDDKKAENVYKGIEALTSEDVAEVIVYTTSLPQNIQVCELMLTPNKQATGRDIYKQMD